MLRVQACRDSLDASMRAAMGIYDRDYNRESYDDDDRMGLRLAGPMSLTTKVVLLMFGVYAVQLVTRPSDYVETKDYGWFTQYFALHADWFRRPWLAFELLTHGFLHDPAKIQHILFNMLGLWMFGRELEIRYGKREYLTFFLAAIVVAGLVWTLGEVIASERPLSRVHSLGASGGIAALVILYAFNYPHRTILLMFVIPMPMWVGGLILVGMDLVGAIQRSDNVAFTAHLGGAAFAALYYKWGIQLSKWLPDGWRLPRFRARPRLRVHKPDESEENTTDSQVDEILRKIQEHGQDSLSAGERRILEEASKEYQRRRR
jgi:membrane associated rhomboid family serine protease